MDHERHTLKPPAVPAFMISSGFNAWTEAQVTSAAETVPTLSTPGKKFKESAVMEYKEEKKKPDASRQCNRSSNNKSILRKSLEAGTLALPTSKSL